MARASVLLPEPLGPMMACTSPVSTVKIDAAKNFLAPAAHMQILDLEHADVSSFYPTEPSRLTLSSFCASTANSIGSSRKTSLQKPLTIMFTASSAESPRWRQ